MPASGVSPGRWGLVPLRIVVGLVFLVHGGQKLFVFGLPGTADILGKIGIPMASVAAGVLIFAELAGGFAILSGLFVRWAGLVLAFDMAVAIFASRLQGGFFTPYGYEFELTLFGACLTLALVGAGDLSLDDLLQRRAHD